MTPKQYRQETQRTEPTPEEYEEIADQLVGRDVRILHAIIGISTESGELSDAAKKAMFYGRSLDRVNLIEEVGDLLWYTAIILNECNVDFEDVMERNIAKLRVRFPGKFDPERAANRDLEAERDALESSSDKDLIVAWLENGAPGLDREVFVLGGPRSMFGEMKRAIQDEEWRASDGRR